MHALAQQYPDAQLQENAYLYELDRQRQAEFEALKQELWDEKVTRKLLELELLQAKAAHGSIIADNVKAAGSISTVRDGEAVSISTEHDKAPVDDWLTEYCHGSPLPTLGSGSPPPANLQTTPNEQDEAVKKWLEEYRALASASGPALPNPLHWAARTGQLRIVQFFVQSKADLNALDENGDAPLHLAAENGHADVVRCLATAEAQLDMFGGRNLGVLHIAAEKGFVDVVDVILAAGADVNALGSSSGENMKDMTALHLAVENGHLEVVHRLIKAGAKLDVFRRGGEGRPYWPALHVAADKGFATIVEALLAAGADVNAKLSSGTVALHVAANEDVVASLLRAQNADVDAARCWHNHKREPGDTPLHVALAARRWGVVRLLLEAGASITAEGGTRAAMEAIVEDLDTVQLMLNKGAADAAQLGVCLCAAAEKQSIAVVDALLRAGVLGDATCHVYDYPWVFDESALYFAVAAKDAAMVKRLLAAGANPDAVRAVKHGVKGNVRHRFDTEPALYTAVRAGSLEIVKSLVAAGADVRRSDFCDNHSHPPVKRSILDAACGQPEIIKYLKSLGVGEQTPWNVGQAGAWGRVAMPQAVYR